MVREIMKRGAREFYLGRRARYGMSTPKASDIFIDQYLRCDQWDPYPYPSLYHPAVGR